MLIAAPVPPHCDASSHDPHSAAIHGVERAFAFFSVGYDAVEKEFAPRHNDGRILRVLDTLFAFAICSIELAASYHIFGREGLFVTYTVHPCGCVSGGIIMV